MHVLVCLNAYIVNGDGDNSVDWICNTFSLVNCFAFVSTLFFFFQKKPMCLALVRRGNLLLVLFL